VKTSRMIITVSAVVAVGASGFLLWPKRSGTATAVDQGAASTAKAERGPIRMAVASTGRVISNLDVDIKCRASGEVIQLPKNVSDEVKVGDLLFELDPADMQRNVDRAKAALAEAAARAKYARVKAERTKQMMPGGASQDDFDAADATAAEAEAQAEMCRIALADAEQQRRYCRVVSPIAGVVSARNVEKGAIIASGVSNVGGGTTVMTISDLSRVFVVAAVDESDVGKVKTEQVVQVTVDAFPGQRFLGTVVQIAAKGENVSNVVTYPVKIEVASDNKTLLKPEMTANVEIVAAEKAEALLVPAEAVTRRHGRHSVQVVASPGTPSQEREVAVGISDGTRVEIVSGLASGDTVLLNKSADSK